MLKLGVLASGRGTALQGVIDAIHAKTLNAKIELIISNKSDAPVLEKAKNYNIKHLFINPLPSSRGLSAGPIESGMDPANKSRDDGSLSRSRERYDETLSTLFKDHHVDLILLVGYMRILSTNFITDWRDKILNVHPSLLPAFAGLMDLSVHQAVLDSGVKETGCTIHRVTEVVDGGEILLQKRCRIETNDTVESLKQKVQALENNAFVEVLERFISRRHCER